ncbi:MAG: hypothetical protein V7699_00505 [Porticoccus sp.]
MHWFLGILASLRTTLVALLLLMLGVLLLLSTSMAPTTALAPAITLLALNLLVAIFKADKIRRSTALLIFHIALLAIILLVITSRMTYLKGWVELAEGEGFFGLTGILHHGLLHPNVSSELRFIQGDMEFGVFKGKRTRTHSWVTWYDASGKPSKALIKDQTPFTLRGYQFSISRNYGFAPQFIWRSGDNIAQGLIKLPSLPFNLHDQAQTWSIPGTNAELWTQLQYTGLSDTRFNVPEDHHLVIRVGEARHELRPGESVDLPTGKLTYRGLKRWIGYDVFYDWTIPWLLGSCLTALISLGTFLYQKIVVKPWLQPDK